MFCWIQIEHEEAERLENGGDSKEYHYNHPVTGASMVEFHMGTSDYFQRKMRKMLSEVGQVLEEARQKR